MARTSQFDHDGRCRTCGEEHPRCTGHRRDGRPCGRRPIENTTVCVNHGGSAPMTQRAAAERSQRRELEGAARRFSLRQDIDPAKALLDLVQYQAGVVAFWREQVELVPREQLTWGILKRVDKYGTVWRDMEKARALEELIGDVGSTEPELLEHSTTEGAAVDMSYQLLREASKDLAEYAAAALKAGIEERTVRVAESQGAVFAEAQRAILARMLEEVITVLRSAGVEDDVVMDALRRGWAAAVGVVVPTELRAIAVRAGA